MVRFRVSSFSVFFLSVEDHYLPPSHLSILHWQIEKEKFVVVVVCFFLCSLYTSKLIPKKEHSSIAPPLPREDGESLAAAGLRCGFAAVRSELLHRVVPIVGVYAVRVLRCG